VLAHSTNRPGTNTCQALYGFNEPDVLGEHDELDHVAAHAAPEAAPALRRRKDDQVGTSAISMEQAPADNGPSLPFEVNRVRGDDVLNGVALLEGSRVDSTRTTDVRGD